MEVETNGVTNGIEYYSTQCVSKLKSNKAETHSENEKIAFFYFFLREKTLVFVHFHPGLNIYIRFHTIFTIFDHSEAFLGFF